MQPNQENGLNGERHHLDMANYIGNDIGQQILRNQTAMNEKIALLSEKMIRLETKFDNMKPDDIWKKLRSHDKVIWFCSGGAFTIGWFARVIAGK